MGKIIYCGITLASCVGLTLASCASPMQSPPLMGGAEGRAMTAPKTISGALLDRCVDTYRKYQKATFPEGVVATYSIAGVNAVATHRPPGPSADYRVDNLVSYQIAIFKRFLDADNVYAFCYYKYSNGKLIFVGRIETNGFGDINSKYLYNVSADIYEKLIGRKIYRRY